MGLICTALWMLHLDNLRVLEVADSLIPRMLLCGTSNQKGDGVGVRVKTLDQQHHITWEPVRKA